MYGIPPATFAAQRTNLQEVRTNLQDLPSWHRIDRVVTHKEFSMVKIGDQIKNPLSGERFVFLTTGCCWRTPTIVAGPTLAVY